MIAYMTTALEQLEGQIELGFSSQVQRLVRLFLT